MGEEGGGEREHSRDGAVTKGSQASIWRRAPDAGPRWVCGDARDLMRYV